MGTYYNLRTDLRGGDVCDKSQMFKISDGKLIWYNGESKGFFKKRFDYSQDRIFYISKSTRVENKPTVFPTGSGMVVIDFPDDGKFEYHIFGNVLGFIEDIKSEIQNASR